MVHCQYCQTALMELLKTLILTFVAIALYDSVDLITCYPVLTDNGNASVHTKGSIIFKNSKTRIFPYAHCYDHIDTAALLAEYENKNAQILGKYRWPKGVIPYVFDKSLYLPADKKIILYAMQLLMDRTCIQFKERETEANHVRITNKKGGCFSAWIGMHGKGPQILNLNKEEGCIYPGTAAHELIHVIGFWHEQSRKDRDKYITVQWGNIQNKYRSQFAVHTNTTAFKFPYNVRSIMHYPAYNTFAKDTSKPTMVSNDKNNPIPRYINNIQRITDIDAAKINAMYMNCE